MERDHVDHVQQHPEPHDDDPATDPLRGEQEPAPQPAPPAKPDPSGKPRPGVEYDPPVVIE